MTRVRITGVLTYDAGIMHSDDQDAIDWFYNDILRDPGLIVHSNEIGDEIGTLAIETIEEVQGTQEDSDA